MTAPVQFQRAPSTGGTTPAENGVSERKTAPGPVRCGLCGYRFVPGTETMACARCPMARGCAVICCPRCGYEFVTESRLVNFLRRIFSR
jgi:hypothetical protein